MKNLINKLKGLGCLEIDIVERIVNYFDNPLMSGENEADIVYELIQLFCGYIVEDVVELIKEIKKKALQEQKDDFKDIDKIFEDEATEEDDEEFIKRKINESEEKLAIGFKNFLLKRRYAQNTVFQYTNSIFKVSDWENVSFHKICNSINYYVERYDRGGMCEKKGEIGHRTIINALKRLQEFLQTGHIEPIKLNLIVETNSLVTIKYLDEEFNGEEIKVSCDINKGKEIEGVEYLPSNNKIILAILGKREKDIVKVETEFGFANIQIMKIENDY